MYNNCVLHKNKVKARMLINVIAENYLFFP